MRVTWHRPGSTCWFALLLCTSACVGEIGPLGSPDDGGFIGMDASRDASATRDGAIRTDTASGDARAVDDVAAVDVTPTEDVATLDVPATEDVATFDAPTTEDAATVDVPVMEDVATVDVRPMDSCVPTGAEVCNGVDDDCDGAIDEGLGRQPCGLGPCARTVERCINGVPQTCTPGTPGTETCNGIDDDCDGNVDDGLGGMQTQCGTGACMRMVSSCSGGTMPMCVPGTPGTETCNGLDDDCDGTVDDNIAQQSCGTGACRRMVSGCMNGRVPACTPGAPATEICGNGIDEDCDGTPDDGCTTAPSVANMLTLVNQARSVARMCGTTSYPAVPALSTDARLTRAAQLHSEDQARTNTMTHTGSDGSTLGTRVTRQGYGWSALGENVASGQRTDTAAMTSWLNSSGHCANIMSSNFRHFGAGVAVSTNGTPYWTQVFGRP